MAAQRRLTHKETTRACEAEALTYVGVDQGRLPGGKSPRVAQSMAGKGGRQQTESRVCPALCGACLWLPWFLHLPSAHPPTSPIPGIPTSGRAAAWNPPPGVTRQTELGRTLSLFSGWAACAPTCCPPGLPRPGPLPPHAAPQTLLCAYSSPRRLQPPGPGWHRGARQPARSCLCGASSCCGYESEGIGCEAGVGVPDEVGDQGSGPHPATSFCPQVPPTCISPQTRRKRCFQPLRQVPASPRPLLRTRGWVGGVGAYLAHAPGPRWPSKAKAYVSGSSSRPLRAKPVPPIPQTGPQNDAPGPWLSNGSSKSGSVSP